MTDHYVVDSGSRLKAWDVNAYTQAIVTATKEGKIIDVDSAVKIGNEWEVRYMLGDDAYEEAKELTQTLVEAEESHKAQADAELVKVVAEPKPKATRKRRAPRTT